MLVPAFLLLALHGIPQLDHRRGIVRLPLAKDVRMPADQFRGDFLQDALDLKLTALARDLRVHQNQEHDIPQFFPQIFVVLLADGSRDFVGLFE